MKRFKEPPLEVIADMRLIETMLAYRYDYDWNDPKTYDTVIADALSLIKAATYARVEVVKNLKGD
jgi:hypothetical protein